MVFEDFLSICYLAKGLWDKLVSAILCSPNAYAASCSTPVIIIQFLGKTVPL
jgi:hypothetical protein